jgi:poly(3-hydroxybutyrate) depolymerase
MCGMGNSWNAGTCCHPANSWGEQDVGADDVAFVRSVVAEVSAQLCVDKRQVFAAGYSNGGMLAHRLACEASDLVAGIASVASVIALRPGGGDAIRACAAAYGAGSTRRATSVLDIHGDEDIAVPFGGNFLLGFPGVMETMTMWSGPLGNGCSGGPQPAWATGATGRYSSLQWSGCNKGSLVELVKVAKGEHEWYNHAPAFTATTYILDFFDRVANSRFGLPLLGRNASAEAIPTPLPNPTPKPKPQSQRKRRTATAPSACRRQVLQSHHCTGFRQSIRKNS